MSSGSSDDVLIERLLRVIDEGRRTATYKMALLVALIDAAASMPGESRIPTRVIADRALEVYYPQTRPFVDRQGEIHVMRQISVKNSVVLEAVGEIRRLGESLGLRTLSEVRRALPKEVEDVLDRVEDTFVRFPIPLLQVVGNSMVPFLYEADWPEGTSVRVLRRAKRAHVRLLEGVASRLVVLGPMLRPLIELHWARDVAKWSAVPSEDENLRSHLFGSSRVAFPSHLVGGLRELQNNECFYCGDRLVAKCEVDHFVAWSRWQNDAVENLVVADRCNASKSDHLAGEQHLVRWRLRIEGQRAELSDIASRSSWLADQGRSWALARTVYENISAGTPLWVRGREFEFATGPLWKT